MSKQNSIKWLAEKLYSFEKRLSKLEKPDKPEPECNCDPPFFCAVSCPIHGATAVFKKQKAEYDRLNKPKPKYRCEKCNRASDIIKFNPCPFCDPTPSLNARVAKALGREVTFLGGRWRTVIPAFSPE